MTYIPAYNSTMNYPVGVPKAWGSDPSAIFFNEAVIPGLEIHNFGDFVQELMHGGTDTLSGDVQESLKTEIDNLFESTRFDNWDEQGSDALHEDTIATAKRLVEELPDYAGEPDVSATPHGEVDFDWIVDRSLMLTVSVGPKGKEIAFAGLFHGARLDGREQWTGTLPQFVCCCFERLRDCMNQ